MLIRLSNKITKKGVGGGLWVPQKRPLKKSLLTFSLLPFPQDGIQPFLLVLCIFGHADKPLVLSRVVDLPAVSHCVVVAVIVS